MTAAVPAYTASSSVENNFSDNYYGTFAQMLILNFENDQNTVYGISSEYGGVASPSGDYNWNAATATPLSPSGMVTHGSGVFTPGGTLGGSESGSYGGVGFWYGVPAQAQSVTLPSGAVFTVTYSFTFESEFDVVEPDGFIAGATEVVVTQKEGEAVRATGINSVPYTATFGEGHTEGNTWSTTVTYQTMDSLTVTAADKWPYGQILLSQVPPILYS